MGVCIFQLTPLLQQNNCSSGWSNITRQAYDRRN